jgi:hypothetical protein
LLLVRLKTTSAVTSLSVIGEDKVAIAGVRLRRCKR